MAKARTKSTTGATNPPPHKSTLPHHTSSGDTLADDDDFPTNTGKARYVHGDDDYPTPNSVEEAGQTSRQQTFNISSSSTNAIDSISKEPRKLLNAINNIALLGIEQNIDLPKIVAIGDQSAGKSSVIAAISGITVPRNQGVCTRCPTLISLNSAPDKLWSCTISLERQHIYDKGKWHLCKEPQSIPFAHVEDSRDLENLLICAQAATLCPAQDPSVFVNRHPDHLPKAEDFQVPFSPNLVRLDISGPECPDLTFYDLPGVFNQAARADQQHLPKEIKSLVQKYILPENHLLLLAQSMEVDIENSLAGSLIENAHAGDRTIGLLTKPDRLAEGTSSETLASILNGEAFKLGHGYFVTKQPSQKDLERGVDHRKARENEAKFFTTAPWSTELSEFQPRFGTVKLQNKLSELLAARIRRSIPILLQQYNEEVENLKDELKTLPEPPGNKSLSIVHRITSQIHTQLNQHLLGELPHNAFIRKWSQLCQQFSKALFDLRPTLVVNSEAEIQRRSELRELRKSFMSSSPSPSGRAEAISIDDSDDEQKPRVVGQKRSAAGLSTPSPQKKQKTYTPNTSMRSNASSTSSNASGTVNKFTLDSVRKTRLDKNTSAIGTHDHRADEYLILQSINWSKPLEDFIAAVKDEVNVLLKELLDHELREWQNTPIWTELRAHVGEFIQGAIARHSDFANRMLESEKIKPMTLNLKSNRLNVEEETNVFRTARRKARANLYFDDLETKSGKPTSGNERDEKIRKLTDDLLGPDEYAEEIATMGRVRGYYNVASASLVDNVCKAMRLDLFERLRQDQGLRDSIERKFKLHENEGMEECKRLLAEDSRRAKRREDCLRQKAKLEKAIASLAALFGPTAN